MTTKTSKWGRPTKSDAVINKIQKLKEGESLIVNRKEWEYSDPVGANILRRRTGREYLVRTLQDRTGWYVTAL